MFVQVLLSLCLIFSMLLATFGQQPSPSPKQTPTAQEKPAEIDSQDVVRITTNLVQVDVVVTKGDKLVSDLQPEDFEIFEDGKPQTITNFSYVSNVPDAAAAKPTSVARSKDKSTAPVPPAKINLNDQRRTIALVVDDLGISWESMHAVKTQIKKFIDELSPMIWWQLSAPAATSAHYNNSLTTNACCKARSIGCTGIPVAAQASMSSRQRVRSAQIRDSVRNM